MVTLLRVAVIEQLAEKYESLAPLLDERPAAALARCRGAGVGPWGVSAVARATGSSRSTVTAAVKELAGPQAGVPAGRVRRVGAAGRPSVTATDPVLVAALEALVDPATRGDPMSPLRWTSKSTRTLAAEVRPTGACDDVTLAQFQISATVGRLNPVVGINSRAQATPRPRLRAPCCRGLSVSRGT